MGFRDVFMLILVGRGERKGCGNVFLGEEMNNFF